MDTELFYSVVPSETELALAVCTVCPVRDVCLEVALSRPELDGVWGGTTAGEREAMLRGGRPRVRYEIGCGAVASAA